MRPAIANLPKTDTGLPIPWMISPDTGELNAERAEHAMHRHLCGICNGQLGNAPRALIFPGPESILNRHTPLPAFHPTCAAWWLTSTWGQELPLLCTLETVRGYDRWKFEDQPFPNLAIQDGSPPVTIAWFLHGQPADTDAAREILEEAYLTLRAQADDADQETGLNLLYADTLERLGINPDTTDTPNLLN